MQHLLHNILDPKELNTLLELIELKASNDVISPNEMERLWKETEVDYFKVMSQNLLWHSLKLIF
jgi:hypothetical protein